MQYPNGTSGITVTQNNTCEPTSQGGLHCNFTGSGSTWKSLRGVKPYARFHWSDTANARTVYRYQIATISHTNTFHYGNLVPMEFFGYGLSDGYHEWSGIGSYANCSPYYCDLSATFYMLGGYGTYTWSVDTYVAPVAIDIYAPTVTPTSTATATPTRTVTPSQTPTNTPSPTPTPQDRWYTGNDRQGAYGVKAEISAPCQPLNLESIPTSGESSWVSIPRVSERWMQAGWRYYWFYPTGGVRPYVEWKTANPPAGENGYYIQEYRDDLQTWGTFETYSVFSTGGTWWCGQYSTFPMYCSDIGTLPPKSVFAHSEVHASPLNELNTIFKNVQYMDSTGNWNLFDEARWVMEAPYSVDQWFLFEFRNYGP